MKAWIFVVLAAALIVLGLPSCGLFDLIQYRQYMGDVFIRITLFNLPEELTFNHAHVPTGESEYNWFVVIDTDNNGATGDSGNDIRINFYYKKRGLPTTDSVIETCLHDTDVLPYPESGIWYETAAYIEGDSIILRPFSLWSPAGWDAGYTWEIYGTYYTANYGTAHDAISGNGNTVLGDPPGDLLYGTGTPLPEYYEFIDIVEIEIEYPYP